MSDLFACVGSLGFIFLVLSFIVVMRYISYRETLKLADKGLVKPNRSVGNGKGTLIWGIIITAIGLALMVGLWPLGAMLSSNVPFGFGPWMLAGLLPMFFGLALILIHILTYEPKSKNDGDDLTETK